MFQYATITFSLKSSYNLDYLRLVVLVFAVNTYQIAGNGRVVDNIQVWFPTQG